jgi:hypothetical protein
VNPTEEALSTGCTATASGPSRGPGTRSVADLRLRRRYGEHAVARSRVLIRASRFDSLGGGYFERN